MRKGVSVDVSAADRARLEAVVADRNSPQKHVWRARIILGTADGRLSEWCLRRAAAPPVRVLPAPDASGHRPRRGYQAPTSHRYGLTGVWQIRDRAVTPAD